MTAKPGTNRHKFRPSAQAPIVNTTRRKPNVRARLLQPERPAAAYAGDTGAVPRAGSTHSFVVTPQPRASVPVRSASDRPKINRPIQTAQPSSVCNQSFMGRSGWAGRQPALAKAGAGNEAYIALARLASAQDEHFHF